MIKPDSTFEISSARAKSSSKLVSFLPRPQRAVQVRKMLYGSMTPIDLIVYTPKEIDESKENRFSFVYEVLNAGKTLYERAI